MKIFLIKALLASMLPFVSIHALAESCKMIFHDAPLRSRPMLVGEALFDVFGADNYVLGGAPLNVAWHLQAWKTSPVIISKIGNDTLGKKIIDTLESWRLDIQGVQVAESGQPTGTVQIKMDKATKQHEFEILPNQAYDHIQASKVPADLSPSLIYHGSLALRTAESKLEFKKIIQRYPDAPLFIDINLRQKWWDKNSIISMISKAKWLKINDEELNVLYSLSISPHEQAKALLRDYSGVETVYVTLGAKGAIAVTRDNLNQVFSVQPKNNAHIVDTVGAGDSFASVLILGLQRGWDLQTTLLRAQTFASQIVGVEGATVSDLEFYKSFIEEWEL